MHAGFNGEVIMERLDQMAAFNHRLLITEFDTEQGNLTERAFDVEDFLRMTPFFSRSTVQNLTP